MKKLLAFLTLLTMASCVQGAAWGDPAGFFDQEKIESKQLSTGVTWISASGEKWGSPFQIQIITVDLQHPNVSLRMLSGSRFLSKKPGHFVARSTISQYLKDGGALAAINIPFFEIASSQMPFGLLMIDRKLLREPSPH